MGGSIYRYGRTPAERFYAKIQPTKPNGCQEWRGANNTLGYGVLEVKGERFLAHRFAWKLRYGRLPRAMKVLHRCDNPPCCNPDHLWLGTMADNSRDMVAKGRSTRKAECRRGHPLSGYNLYITPSGRHCRACGRIRTKAYEQRKRAVA